MKLARPRLKATNVVIARLPPKRRRPPRPEQRPRALRGLPHAQDGIRASAPTQGGVGGLISLQPPRAVTAPAAIGRPGASAVPQHD
jgi:hypothetical protein